MVETDAAVLSLSWAATLLLHTGDISRHLKEFESVFPGLGGQLPIQRDQCALLHAEGLARHVANPAYQPVQTYIVAPGYGDQGFQAGRVLAVLDVGNV